MAHQLEQMAYVGETPWHGLGNQLSPHQPIEVWAQQAGMDWRIESSNVSYMAKNDRGQSIILPYEEQRVLYRSDTHAPLSVVSQRFQEVQPKEILEFYRDLTEQSGFELETAGVLNHPMSVTWQRMIGDKALFCRMRNSVFYTVPILMHLYRWSVNAFRKFSPKKSLSSIGT